MSIKTTIGRVLGVESDAGHVEPNRVGLALPNLDERTAIYLRAIHGDRDFSGEEFSKARAIILDAMRDDVGLRSKESSEPEDVPEGIDIGTSEEAGHWAMASMEALPRASMVSAARYSLRMAPPMASRRHALTEAAWFPLDRETKRISRTSKNRTFTYSALAAVLAVVIVAPAVWFANHADSGGPNFSAVSSNLGQVREVSSGAGKSDKLASPPPLQERAPPIESDGVQLKAPLPPPKVAATSPANIARPVGVNPVADRPVGGSPEVSSRLLERGRQLLAARNIEESRSALKQAADMGNASAALSLGATYDPIEIKELAIEGISPDISLARHWYEKAKELGSPDAVKRLDRLSSRAR